MPVPFSFGAATSAIPLSQLDSNFNTPITLGNTAIQLGNTVTTLNNMTLANVTISSGNVTITNVTVTTANATTVNTTTLIATTANVTTGNVTNLISGNVTLTGGSITGTPISGSTGSFTTLTTSGTVTLNGGVANGVAYLDGSKVLTTGSALTFDGTTFSGTTNAALAKVAGAVGWVSVGDNNTGAGALRLFGGSTQKGWQIGSNVTVADALEFSQATAGGGTIFTQQMILTSTGLGIGTSSPASKLTVSRGGSAGLVSNFTDGLAQGLALTTGTGYFGFYNPNYGAITFRDGGNASELMRLDSSGNLGLGVTPSAWSAGRTTLQINGTTQPNIQFTGNPTNGGAIWTNSFFDGTSPKYVATGAASIFATSNGGFQWQIAPSGTAGNAITFTQAMTLDASGNLGLGSTSPTSYANFIYQTIQGTNGAGISLRNTAGTTLSEIYQNSSGLGIVSVSNLPIFFNTNNTERARITSAGYFKASNNGTYGNSTASFHELNSSVDDAVVLVRNTNATNAAQTGGINIDYSAAAPNNIAFEFLRGTDTGATRFTMRSNGGLVNYQANDVNLSDRREKTNFAPAKSYLDTICAIPVQTFNYIDQSEDDPGLTLGVVAQDVQAVAPEFVMESNWGTKDNPKIRLSIYQTDLQYALMKCIQELKAEVDSLKAQLKGA